MSTDAISPKGFRASSFHSPIINECLPNEILEMIFSLLTKKEAYIASKVCQSWKNAIFQSQKFSHLAEIWWKVEKNNSLFERKLHSVKEFRLHPLFSGNFTNPSFSFATNESLLGIREDIYCQYLICHERNESYLNKILVGTHENLGFFLDADTHFELYAIDLNSGKLLAKIHVLHRLSEEHSQASFYPDDFSILQCFVLSKKEVVIITKGGFLEIWNFAKRTPKLDFFSMLLTEKEKNPKALAACLLGSKLLLFCSGLENPFVGFELQEREGINMPVCPPKLLPTSRNNAALAAFGHYCLCSIGSTLICFKEIEGKIVMQWIKIECDFNFDLFETRWHSEHFFLAKKKGMEGVSCLFYAETGEEMSSFFASKMELIKLSNDTIIFLGTHNLLFQDWRGQHLGNPEGYTLTPIARMFFRGLKLIDACLTSKRIFVLATGSDPFWQPIYLFEIVPVPFHEEENDSAVEIVSEESDPGELVQQTFPPRWITISRVVLWTLTCMLLTGMFTALSMGSINLSLGFSIGILATSLSATIL